MTDLLVDGRSVVMIKDFQGDVLNPSNSFFWLPASKTIVAGDIVFDGVHPWLADSTAQTRAAWLQSLDFIASLHPRVVIAGHRKTRNDGNAAERIEFMRGYLRAFDDGVRTAKTADALVAAMTKRYPQLAEKKFLELAAKAAFPTHP